MFIISIIFLLFLFPSAVSAQSLADSYKSMAFLLLMSAIGLGITASVIILYTSLSFGSGIRHALFFLAVGLFLVVLGSVFVIITFDKNDELAFFIIGYVMMLIAGIKIYKFQRLFKK